MDSTAREGLTASPRPNPTLPAAAPAPPHASPASVSSSSSTSADPPSPPAKKRRKHNDDALKDALTSGFAGGIAGCVAKTSVAPLDRVKILFQTRSPDYAKYAGTWTGVFRASQDIYAETGVRGLLQGHSATLIRIFPYAAIKFMAYDQLHTVLMPTPESESSARRFAAGASAGIITTAVTYPLELIRVRLAFESHHSQKDRASLLRTIRQIYQGPAAPPPSSSSSPLSASSSSSASSSASPASLPASASSSASSAVSTKPPLLSSSSVSTSPSLTHFYRGLLPTLTGIIPYAGTSFLIWGFLKTDLFPSLFSPTVRQKNRAWLDLLAGGIAGAVGQTTAYPLDIVRRRMQVGPVTAAQGRGGAARAGFWETAGGVWRTQGWRGFFVGLSIGYLKVVPMNAVSFATWVGLKRVLGLEEVPQKKEAKGD
ncbi:hypothetical protein JCM11251_004634 [Rhodosporidiobolus azoricus]